jgi:FAD-dependent urate hydroxylase
VHPDRDSFRLVLDNGETVMSRRVVVAAGVGSFARKPKQFQHLSSEQVSHCYEGKPVHELARKRVVVIGAGQSALESAAILHEAGADVEVIAQLESLRWIGQHKWLHQLGPISKVMYSKHDIGPFGISRLVATPNIVARLPLSLRDKLRKRAVRAAGSAWLPDRLREVKISTSTTVTRAESVGDEVELALSDGTRRRVDHVLLGTGYRVDISRYAFLPKELLASIRQIDGYPIVDAGFCSSIHGLHFIGATAARSFGPLLQFVTGTEFTSKQLTSHIVRRQAATSVRKIQYCSDAA